MALQMSRIDRVVREYDITAKDADGAPATPSAVALALLPPRQTPTSSTTWTPVTFAGGTATVTYAGPDASSSGAIVVTGNCDAWMKTTVGGDIVARKLERITVPGSSLQTLPAGGLDSLTSALVNDQNSALYAALASRFGFGGHS